MESPLKWLFTPPPFPRSVPDFFPVAIDGPPSGHPSKSSARITSGPGIPGEASTRAGTRCRAPWQPDRAPAAESWAARGPISRLLTSFTFLLVVFPSCSFSQVGIVGQCRVSISSHSEFGGRRWRPLSWLPGRELSPGVEEDPFSMAVNFQSRLEEEEERRQRAEAAGAARFLLFCFSSRQEGRETCWGPNGATPGLGTP